MNYDIIIYVIAQILSFISVGSYAFSVLRKSKKDMIGVQVVTCFCDATYALLMRVPASCVCSFAGLIRNILIWTKKDNKIVIYLLAGVVLVTGVWSNTLGDKGWIGLLPVAATVGYTIAMSYTKNIRQTRVAGFVTMTLWTICDWALGFWVYAVFDTFNTGLLLFRIIKPGKDDEK